MKIALDESNLCEMISFSETLKVKLLVSDNVVVELTGICSFLKLIRL